MNFQTQKVLPGQSLAKRLQITNTMLRVLAPLPDTALRLISLLNDPNASFREIADLAVRDVGISSSVLRMANSAMYGLRGTVGSISQAIRVIGTAQTRLLVLSSGVSRLAEREVAIYGLPAGAFMRHAELVANLAMTIAHEAGYRDIGLAYSTGLLHDLGKIVLNGLELQKQAKAVLSLETEMQQHQYTLLEAERELYGGDHAEVGKQVAEVWSLPVEMSEAIALHHEASVADDPATLVYCVQLANGIAGTIDTEYHRLTDATAIVVPEWLGMETVQMVAHHCGFSHLPA